MESDKSLIFRALDMYANWVETGNPLLGMRDALDRKLPVRPLGVDQMKLIIRLRELAEKQIKDA